MNARDAHVEIARLAFRIEIIGSEVRALRAGLPPVHAHTLRSLDILDLLCSENPASASVGMAMRRADVQAALDLYAPAQQVAA